MPIQKFQEQLDKLIDKLEQYPQPEKISQRILTVRLIIAFLEQKTDTLKDTHQDLLEPFLEAIEDPQAFLNKAVKSKDVNYELNAQGIIIARALIKLKLLNFLATIYHETNPYPDVDQVKPLGISLEWLLDKAEKITKELAVAVTKQKIGCSSLDKDSLEHSFAGLLQTLSLYLASPLIAGLNVTLINAVVQAGFTDLPKDYQLSTDEVAQQLIYGASIATFLQIAASTSKCLTANGKVNEIANHRYFRYTRNVIAMVLASVPTVGFPFGRGGNRFIATLYGAPIFGSLLTNYIGEQIGGRLVAFWNMFARWRQVRHGLEPQEDLPILAADNSYSPVILQFKLAEQVDANYEVLIKLIQAYEPILLYHKQTEVEMMEFEKEKPRSEIANERIAKLMPLSFWPTTKSQTSQHSKVSADITDLVQQKPIDNNAAQLEVNNSRLLRTWQFFSRKSNGSKLQVNIEQGSINNDDVYIEIH